MARYRAADTSERRTKTLGIKLAPQERADLAAAAARQGATLSEYSRTQLFREGQNAGMRRNPEAAALLRALDAAGHQSKDVGNNLNQIARHLNTTGELNDAAKLRAALDLYQRIAARHLEALDRVLTL